ncbi:MAG: hypothetical protein GXZ13_07380 [Synergistaceae bacterium]|nr:hypothetical protein [Synergistaceae bacterium]
MSKVLVYIVLIVIFSVSSLSNLRSKKEIIYPVRRNSSTNFAVALIIVIFAFLSYRLGKGNLLNYLIIALGALYVITCLFSQGITRKGLRYHSSYKLINGVFKDWSQVKDYSFNIDSGELQMVEYKNRKLFVNLYFNKEDALEIDSFLSATIDKK